MLKLRCALIALACVVSGCSAEKPNVKSAPTTTDSAGVTIVSNIDPLWDDNTRWRLDSTPITRVGHDENEVQSQFSAVGAATRLSNGNIVVAVRNEVRMFGADGKFIRTVARNGNGPGEFQYIGSLLKLPDDSVLVSQAMVEGGRKIAVYSADGSFIREERPNTEAWNKLGRWSECESRVFPDRSWLGCKKDSTIPLSATNRKSVMVGVMSDPGPGLLRRLERWHIIPATLDRSYAIGIEGGIEQFGVARKGGGTDFVQHPFYSRSHIASGGTPLRIVTFTNPQYNIEIWTPDGKLERIIRSANGRRAPTPSESAEGTELARKWNSGRRTDPATIEALISAVPAPDSLPAASSLHVGSDGYIAVGREGFLPSHPRTLYDIFDPKGQLLGQLELPRRTYLMELGTDYILALHRDDDDVPIIQVHKLHRGNSQKTASVQTTNR